MKRILHSLFGLIVFLFVFSNGQYAQGTKYCKMLGKTLKDVKTTYGAPTFQNLDEVTMQWIFYQLGGDKVTFVSNETNVFQVQADITCNTKKESQKKLEDFLKECNVNKMTIDTLKDGNFKISGNGVMLDLYISENLSRDVLGFKYKAVMTDAKKE